MIVLPDPQAGKAAAAVGEIAPAGHEEAVAPAPATAVPPRWGIRDTVVVVLLLLLAAGLRFPRLAEPGELVFDETYYAKDACLYAGHSPQFCRLDQATEQSYVHPPLGKWLIGTGIMAFGYDPFGWRFASAATGTLLVAVVFAVARKLFVNRWAAGVAGLLAAADFLLIVQSRTAMLDIFLAFFVLLGFGFLAADRARVLALIGPNDGAIRRGLWLRFAAGAAFGLAFAVKWSAVWALLSGFLLACFWSGGLLKALGRKPAPREPNIPTGSGVREVDPVAGKTGYTGELLATISGLVLVPGLIYLAVYLPYFVDRAAEECPYTVPAAKDKRFFGEGFAGLEAGRCVEGGRGAALAFGDLQDRMLDYHLNLTAKHSYQSKAWTWPLVLRPVAYFYETPGGKPTHILGFGNPITWWAAIGSAIWLVTKGFRRWAPERVILAAWAAQYLPWLTVSRPLFFFYMTPLVAFMMMGLAGMLSSARDSGKLMRRLVTVYLVVGVGVATYYFYPVMAAIPLSQDLWESRMWFKTFDCGRFKCGWV